MLDEKELTGEQRLANEQEYELEQGKEKSIISRRKLLASLGIAGAALASTGLIGGALTKAYADPVEGRTKVKDLMMMNLVVSTTIAELRANTNPDANLVYFVRDREQEGPFYYDAADSSSPDNIGTVLVSTSGARFKRSFDGLLNVRWFGAKGDGIHDDADAIQKAIDQAQAIFIPDGTYIIKKTIQISKSNTIISGAGRSTTTLKAGVAIDYVFFLKPANEANNFPLQNITMSKFAIHGANLAKNGIGGFACQSMYSELFVMRTLENGIFLHKGWTSWFDNVACIYNAGNGLTLIPEANAVIIRDSSFMSNEKAGIYYSSGAIVEIKNCTIENNGTYGILIETTSPTSEYAGPKYDKQHALNVAITGCYLEHNCRNLPPTSDSAEIYTLSNSSNLRVENVLIENCYIATHYSRYAFVQNDRVHIVRWRNNHVRGTFHKVIKVAMQETVNGGAVATVYENVPLSQIESAYPITSEMFSVTDFSESGAKRMSGINVGEHHNSKSAVGDITFDRESLKFGIASKTDSGRVFNSIAYLHEVKRADLSAGQIYEGKIVLDTENGTPYVYVGGSWLELAHQTRKASKTISGITFSITKWGNIIQLYVSGTATAAITQDIAFTEFDIKTAQIMNLAILARDAYTIQTKVSSAIYANIPSGTVIDKNEFSYISE
ncbi:glycosyl hydrolase family 28-related protein [Paenibacillus eucommiae]|uniref:Rhamnogalacturonase A/B/Epimerase-like pectate lyase domain-containing protein n=1 Tax=Paenibacillus eucommiae TaxID=1355755 RepID=A0ABS4IMM1_9BACL|nr:glycosyl hydrolase family 28-related protein [Paenibacillus eucommiae]MBP1988789.1 hypothetical protein [Paenibacillus eucommiae]